MINLGNKNGSVGWNGLKASEFSPFIAASVLPSSVNVCPNTVLSNSPIWLPLLPEPLKGQLVLGDWVHPDILLPLISSSNP